MWCSKNLNKISVVAEMGDRARAKWAEKWRGLLCPFWGIWRAGTPCNTMWPGPRPISVLSGILMHPTVLPG